ncbi:MAG: HD domain-containing protein [Firmicutes bacterium]|nr:HD domain-containing protein [Bacillota bacterium]
MFNIKKDYEYLSIVNNILNNEEFNKINKIEHHGITRFEHSLKVSYFSYKIAKALKLNYKDVARGGLLHDFFLSDNERSDKEKLFDTFTHPKRAAIKASETFEVNDLEKDIIVSHMFPFYKAIPKYGESWIVNLTDKVIGSYELLCQNSYKLNCAANYLYLFVLLNLVK